MRHLRITLDFVAQGETPTALAELRAYVAALWSSTRTWGRRSGRGTWSFTGVQLAAAETLAPGAITGRGGSGGGTRRRGAAVRGMTPSAAQEGSPRSWRRT